ncbi:MAG: efflux transporter outer membrane subunit [Bacteroidia bacterium]|nr:efflux transporter outer membrane subunit [Bacteroidia bacterium]
MKSSYKVKHYLLSFYWIGVVIGLLQSCVPTVIQRTEKTTVPEQYPLASKSETNTATVNRKLFFNDPYLETLIDSALANNQELNLFQQEIEIARNEVQARKGEYLPFIRLKAGTGAEKKAHYTIAGATEEQNLIVEEKANPKIIPDYQVGFVASWELDIWKKLRNLKSAAYQQYLASTEGRNWLITRLVTEIANHYYQLVALDYQLQIVRKNIEVQTNALEIVKAEKEATRVTELAVKRFEAQLSHTKSLQYEISQQIIETENEINFLVGRFPQPIQRTNLPIDSIQFQPIASGLPAQLLQNRPDIRQAERNLSAMKLNVLAAKANFYPTVGLGTSIGIQAFQPQYLITLPASLLLNLGGDLLAPLANRNAIKANYFTATAKQQQAVIEYERTILKAYIEVSTQLANLQNLEQNLLAKQKQVQALTESVDISTKLFRSARADYMEVLLTQRDALEAKFDWIETKKQQLEASVRLYQALGGGWK